MVSKAKSKFIKSLQIKKYRKQEQCFIVEGAKSVMELLQSEFRVKYLLGTTEFLRELPEDMAKVEIVEVTGSELNGLGEFQSNGTALAIAEMLPNANPGIRDDEFALVLDDIRDPGNLGTIIRTADWYGIRTIVASEETADFYNPKVISATMGSFTRVKIFYTDLEKYLSTTSHEIFGAFLEGDDLHTVKFNKGGLLVIGNESLGISPEVQRHIKRKITIPRYGKAESLNAAMATGIILDNIRRSVS